METAKLAFEKISPYLVYALVLSLIVSVAILVMFLPTILHKATRVNVAKEIIEQNIQVVEEAIFFKSNTKFQEVIDKQLEEMKVNATEIKKQRAAIDNLIKEVEQKTADLKKK